MLKAGSKTDFTSSPQTKLSKINVLVLDGGAKAANLIKSIFAELGFTNVFIATDGYEGVQVMKEVRIHLIFTDWELKIARQKHAVANQSSTDKKDDILPISGLNFVQRLRRSSLSPNPFIPIVMMMDKADQMQVLEARDSGVNEILLRPVDAQEFCERLVSLIENPRMFITADTYRGPCRRNEKKPIPNSMKERRFKEIRIIKGSGG
jgi:two-component system, chemotaxis family, chemotaxis protein CheY